MPRVHGELTFSRFANKEAIHMNAKMMITDFCIRVPRALVRRNTIMKEQSFGQFLVAVDSYAERRD